MALSKAITTPEGFEVTYWVVNPVFSVNMTTTTVSGRISGYVSQSAYEGGKPPVADQGLALSAQIETDVCDQRGALYEAAKLTDKLSGAVDA